MVTAQVKSHRLGGVRPWLGVMGVVLGMDRAIICGVAGSVAHMGLLVSMYSHTRSSNSRENIMHVSSWKATTSCVEPVGRVIRESPRPLTPPAR